MNYQRINVITGWAVWLAATIVYLMTIEPTSAFWDCGEFIASAYKLEVGHPPGAPLFMLLGRLFAMGVSPENAALSINFLSALASSFTILFLFWSITHFAKKVADQSGDITKGAVLAIMGSGVVGALAYAFSDSFWFSAIEGEVYALSSLFTAVVFWAILKWENETESKNQARWIIFIAYMMGLSIGVHLLNLLAIPAIVFIYYFKKFKFSWRGFLLAGTIGVAILGFVQYGIIQGFIKLAASFELFFINTMGMPFNTGVILYAVLVIGLIAYGLYYSKKKNWFAVNTAVLSFMVILIGYSTFATIVVRSYANPPMDENNPENIFALLAYLNREQYGNRPLLHGEYFMTPTDLSQANTDGPAVWMKSFSVKEERNGKTNRKASFRTRFEADKMAAENPGQKLLVVEEYIETGEKKASVPNYREEYCGYFPRMYSSQADHVQEYKVWSNYKDYMTPKGREKLEKMEAKRAKYENDLYSLNYYMNNSESAEIRAKATEEFDRTLVNLDVLYKNLKPTAGEDLSYFASYQLGWMYWRYFMWNYAGRQNDNQGHGDIADGNWLSGVDWVDQERLGNRSQLSETALGNKALNKFLFLPLLLGLIGIFFQLLRAPKDLTVVGLLFFMTGIAIVIYLNQYPNQPRERDYAYAGSFYAFAIWIGLAVYAIYHAAMHMNWRETGILVGSAVGLSAVLYLLETVAGSDHSFSYAMFWMSALASGAFLLAKAARIGGLPDLAVAALSFLMCLSAPGIMAMEGYDDHNRAKRKTAVDFAKNYLDTLAQDAIIFTNGDNDTFPLWYAQEVEGYRTDVRVVNLSLLNTDWYIDQMKRKAYESNPVPFSINEVKYRQGTRDVVIMDQLEDAEAYMDLRAAMEVALDDSQLRTVGDARTYSFFPANRFSLPVDSAKVLANGTVRPQDAALIADTILFEVNRSYILKSNLMVLDLLMTNNWERPVYFAVTTGEDTYMGLSDYFQLEGLAYRLVPVKQKKSKNPNILGGIATDIMYNNVMNEFRWGNMDMTEGAGIYLDENNRRMVTNFRLQMSNLAETLILEEKDSLAIAVLDKAIAVMPEKNAPYDRVLLPMIENYYKAGQPEKATKLSERLFELMESELNYFNSLEPKHAMNVLEPMSIHVQVCGNLEQFARFYDGGSEHATSLTERFDRMLQDFEEKNQEIEGQGRRRNKAQF